MNPPDTLDPAAHSYLAAVDALLRDLPRSEHAELFADIEARLADLQPGHPPTEALGEPAVFVAELRRAAGFDPTPVSSAQTDRVGTGAFVRTVTAREPVAAVIDYVRSLRPAWWALRGYLLVATVLAAISAGGGFGLHALGYYHQAQDVRAEHVSGGVLWFAIVLVAVVCSIVVGRLDHRLTVLLRLVVVLANVVAVFTFVAYPTWWLAPAFGYFTSMVG